MSAPCWTTGPWEAEMFPTTQGYPIRGGTMPLRKGDRVLAVAMDQGSAPAGESRANARLIAAAPDLAEAVRAAIEFIENGVEMRFIRLPDYEADPALKTLPALKAALSRARGDQP